MLDRNIKKLIPGLMVALLLLGCVATADILPESTPTVEILPVVTGLTESEVEALSSLKKMDDYPLYIMHSAANYQASDIMEREQETRITMSTEWACSLFAAFGDKEQAFYGRNFDWEYSPALLLFTDPPHGYASVSMVNIAFFVPEEKIQHLADIPIDQLTELLEAPYLPIDGMNEHGLVVGMAAVPDSKVPILEGREWIGSLSLIREMLDRARTVDEAIDVVKSFNISFTGGPHIHYLVADASGRAVLIELYEDELKLIFNDEQWHVATNFTISAVSGNPGGRCWRYDTLIQQLEQKQGGLTAVDAMDLLAEVSQKNTQWSVVYALSARRINIAMGRDYQDVQIFILEE